MTTTFKTITSDSDVVSTRSMLHEAIPVTGTIISGTYEPDKNIKNYTHGMFQSVYDYPYLSSSANHIFDLTAGYASGSGLSSSANTQNAKKINIYNEMAQVLVGFDESGQVRYFDEDGDLTGGTKIQEAYFVNLTRLIAKDEIKKGSFSLKLGVNATYGDTSDTKVLTITDASGSTAFKVNSPAGEYGILYASGSDSVVKSSGYTPCGLLYYQAGIAVLSASIFNADILSASCVMNTGFLAGSTTLLTGSAISGACDAIRHRLINLSFNNTTEINSTIYFCRANHNEFNYSSNPTYLSASRLVVKNNAQDTSVAFITSVGLYSADNELLAVGKLSEPLRKDPANELTVRVRLDY